MKRDFYNLLTTLILVLLCSIAIHAQNNKDKMAEKLLPEITEFRQKLSAAIEKRDRKTLETMFADDFTHTHAVGKVDNKTARIDSILAGGKTLESAQPEESKFFLRQKHGSCRRADDD